MKEDLYEKYLRNIKNGKTAIRKEYVDRGYFCYYDKREINNHSNSKKIMIDGVNICYDEYLEEAFKQINDKNKTGNTNLYLGKIGKRLSQKYIEMNGLKENIFDYHISIGIDGINHAINKHGDRSEIKRGQKPITINDIRMIPNLLLNSDIIVYMGKSKDNRKIYKFISKNNDGSYNMIDFINNNRKQLGFQSLYIIKTRK